MAEKKSLKLELKFSLSKSPFWKRWHTAIKTFSSQEEADKYVEQRYGNDVKGLLVGSRTNRKGVKTITFELLPHWGANESIEVRSESGVRTKRGGWDAYHKGEVSKYYVHLRFTPVEAGKRR